MSQDRYCQCLDAEGYRICRCEKTKALLEAAKKAKDTLELFMEGYPCDSLNDLEKALKELE